MYFSPTGSLNSEEYAVHQNRKQYVIGKPKVTSSNMRLPYPRCKEFPFERSHEHVSSDPSLQSLTPSHFLLRLMQVESAVHAIVELVHCKLVLTGGHAAFIA